MVNAKNQEIHFIYTSNKEFKNSARKMVPKKITQGIIKSSHVVIVFKNFSPALFLVFRLNN